MKKITIAAVVAIASQAFAEPLPYRPAKAFLSAREIFGLDRRDTDVYHPKQSVCGVAATCSEAVRLFSSLPFRSMKANMLIVWRLLRTVRFHRQPDALLRLWRERGLLSRRHWKLLRGGLLLRRGHGWPDCVLP